ncbi:hypothetical protein L227DRAFT_332806 [Lentinus tigrinus ALCF2SS1-6]|uniref:Uncharacterized protein n=1 Tax=Lentinus tigrinus ALCF2SS1-6 TaxID=1328759 RepID=A0A5C2RWK5_9APHY|nr:hypothetical protein L227DRAFT_332806 [Lentinus tigrinus ALCF2SS1-6]
MTRFPLRSLPQIALPGPLPTHPPVSIRQSSKSPAPVCCSPFCCAGGPNLSPTAPARHKVRTLDMRLIASDRTTDALCPVIVDGVSASHPRRAASQAGISPACMTSFPRWLARHTHARAVAACHARIHRRPDDPASAPPASLRVQCRPMAITTSGTLTLTWTTRTRTAHQYHQHPLSPSLPFPLSNSCRASRAHIAGVQ